MAYKTKRTLLPYSQKTPFSISPSAAPKMPFSSTPPSSDCQIMIWTAASTTWARNVFHDVQKDLARTLRDMGYSVAESFGPKTPSTKGQLIVLGMAVPESRMPPNAIVYQLEQPAQLISKRYVDIMRKHIVWDFSEYNVEYFRKLGCYRVFLCRIGSTGIKPITHVKKDIDVLFYGSVHPRRNIILNRLRQHGVVVHSGSAWGLERERLIERSKIFLNIHYFTPATMELVRLSPVLSKQAFIISETGVDRAIEKHFAGGVIFAPHSKLVETVMTWLRKPQAERDAVATQGVAAWQKLSLKSELERCISQSVPGLCQKRIKCFINNRNRLTMVKNLAREIERLGGEPVIIDNASTYPPLLEWYKSECPYRVHRLDKNVGARAPWLSGIVYKEVGRGELYVTTDPDLDLSNVPSDCFEVLARGLRKHKVLKAGLSLEIKDVPAHILSVRQQQGLTLEQCEAPYWKERLDSEFYNAPVDCTFAMYRNTGPVVLHSGSFYKAVRSDRPYTARHLPWYRTEKEFDEEDRYYVAHREMSRVGKMLTNGSFYDSIQSQKATIAR